MQASGRALFSPGVLQLLMGSVLISFSPVFVKIADVGPTSSGFYRSLFGGMALLVFVVLRREVMWKGRRAFWIAAFAGLLFAADLFFWHRSIQYVGPGLATILGNFQAFFVAAVGILVFRERATWRFIVSVPLAILGLALLVGIDWSSFDRGYKLGVVFGLLTALAYTAYLLTLRWGQRRAPRLPGASNLAWISLICALLLSGSVALEGESLAVPNTKSWVVLVLYGVLCQALGWVAIAGALRKVEASRAGLILLLQPTLAFIWDIVLFGRPTTATEVSGALLALGAIYLGNTGHEPAKR